MRQTKTVAIQSHFTVIWSSNLARNILMEHFSEARPKTAFCRARPLEVLTRRQVTRSK